MTADSRERGDQVRVLLDVPLHRWLGLELADSADPGAGVVLPIGPSALHGAGVCHDGIVAALLDVATQLRLLPELAAEESAVTRTSSFSMLRPVPDGARVLACAELLGRSDGRAFLRSAASVDGELVAHGQVTKTLVRHPPLVR